MEFNLFHSVRIANCICLTWVYYNDMNIVGFPYRFGFIAKSQTGPHFSICLTDVAVKNRHLGSIVLLRHGMRFHVNSWIITLKISLSHTKMILSHKKQILSHIYQHISHIYICFNMGYIRWLNAVQGAPHKHWSTSHRCNMALVWFRRPWWLSVYVPYYLTIW